MSDPITAILLGIIEGLTEFIPVSSTGHLIIFGDYLTLSSGINDTFSIAIQLGAILAVVILEWPIFKPFLTPHYWTSHNSITILIAIMPALLMGFLFYDIIKTYLFNPYTVAFSLITGSILMIIIEKRKTNTINTTEINQISYKQAFKIGLWQCLALSPGMSRSATTIIGGLASQLNHQTAARFSFIIAVPVMIAAVSYDLLKTSAQLTQNDYQLIGIGFITAFIISYFAMISFIKLLNRWKLLPFALYRIVLAVIVVTLL